MLDGLPMRTLEGLDATALPLESLVAEGAGSAWLGPQPLDEVFRQLASSLYLVLPSACYEGFPRTLVEAFACGVPVIASRHGSLQELVDDGRTGLLFDPAQPRELAERLRWANEHPEAMLEMGRAAREEYLARYTPSHNLEDLLGVYQRAIADGARASGVHRVS